MHTEGHDMGRDAADSSTPGDQFNPDQPGYETTDVNVRGVTVFLAGLLGTVVVFFFFCYGMGKVINNLFVKLDGEPTKWAIEAGATPPGGKREDLASNAEMKQRELEQMTAKFPEPRLDIDDGNQATADLHAREDLLLEHYSTVEGQPGTIRIPIERAMELIAQRGLPVAGGTPAGAASAVGGPSVAYAGRSAVKAPLTTGFARTGFELTTIEAREQRMAYGKAEGESTPVK